MTLFTAVDFTSLASLPTLGAGLRVPHQMDSFGSLVKLFKRISLARDVHVIECGAFGVENSRALLESM